MLISSARPSWGRLGTPLACGAPQVQAQVGGQQGKPARGYGRRHTHAERVTERNRVAYHLLVSVAPPASVETVIVSPLVPPCSEPKMAPARVSPTAAQAMNARQCAPSPSVGA